MRHAPGASAPVFLLAGVILTFAVPNGWAAADIEIDKYEERAIAHGIERALRSVKSDRALWVKELENAYPGRVTNAITEDDYATWFVLLAGKGEEWRKDSAANTQIAELFERVVQRLELGPVPSIKRDEFGRYARKALIPGNPPKDGAAPSDQNEDADKVFRVIDRDGDGSLGKEELTLHLRDDRIRADADGNGRISKDEYRLYFQRRVTVAVETTSAKATERGRNGLDVKSTSATAKGSAAMPDWFATLDTDMDGQIALHEWRKASRTIETFMEMDLDDDGLLTRDEYLRFLKKNETQRTRAANAPTMPMMGKQAMK